MRGSIAQPTRADSPSAALTGTQGPIGKRQRQRQRQREGGGEGERKGRGVKGWAVVRSVEIVASCKGSVRRLQKMRVCIRFV